MPVEFLNALGQADMVLSLQENLTADEQPEPWVYIVPWELERHLLKVQANRKHRAENPNAEPPTDYDDGSYEANDLVPDSWK